MDILGNIITLGICLVLLLIFRHVDKNNRTLEKMKRFCDKQKEDFSAFVDGKTKNLETVSIDIGTMTDRAAAALTALREAGAKLAQEEKALTDRREEVERFTSRIGEAEQTVARLMTAIGEADKNLSRIAEESDFADAAARKIQSVKKDLDAVSGQIGQLEQRFSRENAAALSAAREETLSGIRDDMETLQEKIDAIMRVSETLEERTRDSLQEIYNQMLDNAAARAGKMEEQAFEKLQQQASSRLDKYKETIETRTAAMLQQTKEKLTESQQLLKTFKSGWKTEADEMLRAAKTEIETFRGERQAEQRAFAEEQQNARENFARQMQEAEQARKAEQSEFFRKLKTETEELSVKITRTAGETETRLAALDEKLTEFENHSGHRLSRLAEILNELPAIDNRMRTSIQEMENRAGAALELFAQDQNTRRDNIEAEVNARTESLMNKIRNLENVLNELKTHAYANVSEKLRIFEDDFLQDLRTRGETMSAAINSWQENLEEKLRAISAENESVRTDAETEYTEALKTRLAELDGAYRNQTDKLETQIRTVEEELRTRIEQTAESIRTFAGQYRADFLQAKENAEFFARNELQTHSAELQESLRRQRQEMDARYKELAAGLETDRETAEAMMNGIRESVSEWQRKQERNLETASEELETKIEDFRRSAAAHVAEVAASAQDDFSAAVARIGKDTEALRNSVQEIQEKIQAVDNGLDSRREAALQKFSDAFQELSRRAAGQAKAAQEEAETAVRNLKAQGMEIRASLEDSRQKLFRKIQNDADSLSANLEEIAARQKDVAEQARTLSKVEELKADLESGIEKLRIETGNLNVYEETMARLKSQYQEIRDLSAETEQRLSKVAGEKKRIDTIEANLNTLLDISDKTEEKLAEMTRTKDDVLDYQTRIKRFEDSIEKINERYERIERKTLTIDQTLTNADKAFESLRKLEENLRAYREKSAALPEDMDAIRTKLNSLVTASERVGEIESKITQLESELSDTEKRAKRIHADRTAFANLEKRLLELKTEADKSVGLYRALASGDDPAGKGKGAPPVSVRERVKELKHRDWTNDEIAKRMKLSVSEVELILDSPD